MESVSTVKLPSLGGDPALCISEMLTDAEKQAALGELARAAHRAQTAAGKASNAWMYEEMAEACEEAVNQLLQEVQQLYKSADPTSQCRAKELSGTRRWAKCLL